VCSWLGAGVRARKRILRANARFSVCIMKINLSPGPAI